MIIPLKIIINKLLVALDDPISSEKELGELYHLTNRTT